MIPDAYCLNAGTDTETILSGNYLFNKWVAYISADSFRNVLLLFHILCGSLALLIGTLIAFLKKGDLNHKQLGRVYVGAMVGVFITAFIRSIQTGNEFLFAVGFFSLTLTLSAFYAIRSSNSGYSVLPRLVSWLALLTGLGLIILGFWSPFENIFRIQLVSFVFGLISFWMGIEDLQKQSLHLSYKEALRKHITRMGGSLISAWTAFVVVNISFVHPWVTWLFPTLIGSIIISLAVRKYCGKASYGQESRD
jgi:uncharacterized membrane protein